jgi:hypothetical protein
VRAAESRPVARTIARFSWIAVDLPALAELEINPLLAGPRGCVALDVRGRVGS